MGLKPNFIGLGGQKCASTWLYKVVSDHPQVFVSSPKELDFFSCFYDRGAQWYENFFSDAGVGKKAVGEISPSYLPDADAPDRVKQYRSDMKIILCLRDPIGRLISNHSHDVRLQHFTGDDLSIESGIRNNPMYVEQSLFGKHLARWMAVFPRDQFLFLLQEEIRLNPEAEARRIYEFLGVDLGFSSEFNRMKANESYIPVSRRKEVTLRKMGKAMDAIGLRYLADGIRSSDLYQRLKSRNRLKVEEVIPPMKSETRQQLVQLFRDDMQELAKLLERDSLPWATWEDAFLESVSK